MQGGVEKALGLLEHSHLPQLLFFFFSYDDLQEGLVCGRSNEIMSVSR